MFFNITTTNKTAPNGSGYRRGLNASLGRYMAIALLLFIAPFRVMAGTPIQLASAASPEGGVKLFNQCVACHGARGEGNALLKAPAIAGQAAWYTDRQLNNFINGLRGAHEEDINGKQMLAIVKGLSRDDIPALTAYIESLPRPDAQDNETIGQTTGSLKNGSRYYQGKCGACHGGQAEGNPQFNAPRLTHLSASYLHRQLANFTQGIRGNHSEDKLGMQMAMMAKTTSGDELNDIVYFITTLSNNEQK
ncbi:hypothetical protein Ssed_1108 [Shewanella sediminis HAW-EB3]|uniref:Cytochrome c domain-containing protein n=1 Tax=Shewanella sediminis (strain HAW-EB3) TaxID=425104 RepID=A8FS96_SHESH|nr:c-type cytochrome [Shewanella sediminis]ABV35719.1 hypothetical protein Ssed_1108 [Shewanella sediminis HAW-EB3]